MNAGRSFNNVMVTGGVGFIVTKLIRYLFEQLDFRGRIVNIDKLTYAGNPMNLEDVVAERGSRYHFEQADIPEFSSKIYTTERVSP